MCHQQIALIGWRRKNGFRRKRDYLSINCIIGWAWWLMSVTPALWEAKKGVDLLSPGIQGPLGQHSETLVSTKNKKIKKISWMCCCVPVVLATGEAEVREDHRSLGVGGCSEPWLHVTEGDPVSEK